MPARAPRLLLRPWCPLARGAALALGLWLAMPVHAVAQEITDAVFAGPTDAYDHGVLGDDIEWSELHVTVTRRKGQEGGLFSGYTSLTYRIQAKPDSVFEDTEPRLWDVTGDGKPEVVIVESHVDLGARLLVIGLDDGVPEYLAVTGHIGQRHRWMAPLAAGDLNGDGTIEIALVDRPHLLRTLRLLRLIDGGLVEVANLEGVSNHRIGEAFITGGLRDCDGRKTLILTDGAYQRIVEVTYTGDRIFGEYVGSFDGQPSIDAALACE